MAADTEEGREPPQETAAKKGGLAKEWKRLATWQKAGVIIAGVGVAAALAYYVSHQSSPTATGNDAMGSYGLTGEPTGYPGEGDYYPPYPVPPSSSGTTTTGTTTGTTTTRPPVGGPIVPGQGTVGTTPGKFHPIATPIYAPAPKAPAPAAKKSTAQLRTAAQSAAASLFAHRLQPTGGTGFNLGNRRNLL